MGPLSPQTLIHSLFAVAHANGIEKSVAVEKKKKGSKGTYRWLTPRVPQGDHHGLHQMKEHFMGILDGTDKVCVEHHYPIEFAGHAKYSCIGSCPAEY